MKLIPAIDLKNKKCVRLAQGKEDTSKIYNTDPIEQAKFFEDEGCERIHIVDLDAAFGHYKINRETIVNIRKSVKVPIELGGGIRNKDDIVFWFKNDIEYLIIGSLAVKDIELVLEVAKKFDNRIYISLDIFNNKLMIKGWIEESKLSLQYIYDIYNDSKIRGYILTDISRDGMMLGLNTSLINDQLKLTDKPMVVGGGLSSYNDLIKIKNMNVDFKNIEGVIAGKSFYSGAIEIDRGLKILNSSDYA